MVDRNPPTHTWQQIASRIKLYFTKLYNEYTVTINNNIMLNWFQFQSDRHLNKVGSQTIIRLIPSSNTSTFTLLSKNNNNIRYQIDSRSEPLEVYLNYDNDIECKGSNNENILITACYVATGPPPVYVINACLLYGPISGP